MNQQEQIALEAILQLHPSEITPVQHAILRARVSYLTDQQKERFLGDAPVNPAAPAAPALPVLVEDAPAPVAKKKAKKA